MQNLIRILFVIIAGMVVAENAQAGEVMAWGNNLYGQLGDGTNTSSNVPVSVIGLPTGVTAIAGGGWHSLAIQDGAVKAWGANWYGALGNGMFGNSSVPVPVTGLDGGVTAVAGGNEHNLAIQNGAAVAWGYNLYGQLGNGDEINNPAYVPVSVSGLSSGVTAVAAGEIHSLAIQNGKAWAWGATIHGRLGNGMLGANKNIPVAVTGLDDGVTAIAAGGDHSLAIHNGAAKTWGRNNHGQLGDGTSSGFSSIPVSVIGLSSGVTAIVAGGEHNLAIQDGKVYAWGRNNFGQLGDGTATDSNTPLNVLDLDVDLIDVAAGYHSSYALSSDGSLWVWGWNNDGQLGLGDNINRLTPEQLLAPAGYKFTAINAFGNHAVATITPIPEPVSLSLLVLVIPVLLHRRQERGR